MRLLTMIALVLSCVFGASILVDAQPTKKKTFFGFASTLVYNKAAVADLKLDKQQLAKAIAAAERISDKYQKEIDEARKDKDFGKLNLIWPKATKETDKAIAEVLTPKQMNRLEQILKQVYYHETLLDNAKGLKLTAEQRKHIEFQSKAGGPSMTMAEQKAWFEKTFSVLTAEQKKAWESIVGPPYAPVP